MTLRVTMLGTSGAVPTVERNPTGIALNRDGRRLLFDCGEGTQRQMMRYGTGFDVTDVCITHTHGDHVLGLPGLLQTWDFNDRTEPLTVHVPPGEREAVRTLVRANGNETGYQVEYAEVAPGEIVLSGDGFEVRAVAVDHRSTAVGYALVEEDRRGRFDREKAEQELGIEPGPKYSKLHRGEAIEHDGETIHPEQVVGPARPGRTVVYSGDTRPASGIERAAADADLLIHDATFGEDMAERAAETGHATAREAGELASRADVDRLVLTHVSSRYAGDEAALLSEASAAFDGECTLAHDGLEIEVPLPE
jgi:ribonuclease Z